MDTEMSESQHVCIQSDTIPLCVDLDGTLIRSDTLVEALLHLLKHHPLSVGGCTPGANEGKAHLKQWVAQRCTIDPAGLPYNQ